MIKVFGEAIPNMPWEEKGENCTASVWRYSKNPVIARNPLPDVARIFNSAVCTWKNGGFVGVFRAEKTNGIPYLYYGFSDDALNWRFSDGGIKITDENGADVTPHAVRRHLPFREQRPFALGKSSLCVRKIKRMVAKFEGGGWVRAD